MEKEKLIKELHDDLEIVAVYKHVRLSYIIDSIFCLVNKVEKDRSGSALYVSVDGEVSARVTMYGNSCTAELNIHEFKFERTFAVWKPHTGYVEMDREAFNRLVREVEATQ